MTILLIIVLISGMLCVANWKTTCYRYRSDTLLGRFERMRGYLASWTLQEANSVYAEANAPSFADNEMDGVFTTNDDE